MKVSCPICKTSTRYEGNPHRPFCSERCKKIDLGAWASNEYVIPGKSKEVDEQNVSSETDPEAIPSPTALH
jgi:Uncharacterized protein conserved in bacteria